MQTKQPWLVAEEKRAPRLIALENVCGTLTSHDGKDLATICGGFEQAGYRVGAVVVDASLFVPQSRPRLFVIGVHPDMTIPEELTSVGPCAPWHTRTLKTAYGKLPAKTKQIWKWWKLPLPPKRKVNQQRTDRRSCRKYTRLQWIARSFIRLLV